MQQHHSEEVKELAVYQSYSLNYEVPFICVSLKMSHRTVERVPHLWRTTGEVLQNPQHEKRKRKRIVSDDELEVCDIV